MAIDQLVNQLLHDILSRVFNFFSIPSDKDIVSEGGNLDDGESRPFNETIDSGV